MFSSRYGERRRSYGLLNQEEPQEAKGRVVRQRRATSSLNEGRMNEVPPIFPLVPYTWSYISRSWIWSKVVAGLREARGKPYKYCCWLLSMSAILLAVVAVVQAWCHRQYRAEIASLTEQRAPEWVLPLSHRGEMDRNRQDSLSQFDHEPPAHSVLKLFRINRSGLAHCVGPNPFSHNSSVIIPLANSSAYASSNHPLENGYTSYYSSVFNICRQTSYAFAGSYLNTVDGDANELMLDYLRLNISARFAFLYFNHSDSENFDEAARLGDRFAEVSPADERVEGVRISSRDVSRRFFQLRGPLKADSQISHACIEFLTLIALKVDAVYPRDLEVFERCRQMAVAFDQDSQISEELFSNLAAVSRIPFLSGVGPLRNAAQQVFRTAYACIDSEKPVLSALGTSLRSVKARSLEEVDTSVYGDLHSSKLSVQSEAILENGSSETSAMLPTISQMTVDTLTRESQIPTGIPKLALLFLVTGKLAWPKVWDYWLDQAEEYSRELFQKREGPYANVTRGQFEPLFSLSVHYAPSKAVPKKEDDRDANEKETDEALKTPTDFIFDESASDDDRTEREPSRHLSRIVHDSWATNAVERAKEFLPSRFHTNLVPNMRPCYWGDLNSCEYRLFKHALHTSPGAVGFILISESAVPLKPFRHIYHEFFKNTRSRFYFSNVNLPLIRKHHQWIVLHRRHVSLLVQYPDLWTCRAWLWHKYGLFRPLKVGIFGAPDESLPIHALTELIGLEQVWNEINDGFSVDPLAYNDSAYIIPGDRRFRHTWLCWWEQPEYLKSEDCSRYGLVRIRISSPVSYRRLYGDIFYNQVISNNDVWFGRKFSPDCDVLVSRYSYTGPLQTEDPWGHLPEYYGAGGAFIPDHRMIARVKAAEVAVQSYIPNTAVASLADWLIFVLRKLNG